MPIVRAHAKSNSIVRGDTDDTKHLYPVPDGFSVQRLFGLAQRYGRCTGTAGVGSFQQLSRVC